MFIVLSTTFSVFVHKDILRVILAPIMEAFEGNPPSVYQVKKATALGLDVYALLSIVLYYHSKLMLMLFLSSFVMIVFVLRYLRSKNKDGFNETVYYKVHLMIIIISFIFSYFIPYVHRGIESLYRLTPFLSIAFTPPMVKFIEQCQLHRDIGNIGRWRSVLMAPTLITLIVVLNVANYPIQPLLPYITENNTNYKPGGTVLISSNRLIKVIEFAKAYGTECKAAFDRAFFPFGIMDLLHRRYYSLDLNKVDITRKTTCYYILACFSEKDMPFGEGMQELLNYKFENISKHFGIAYNSGLVVILLW